MKYILLSLFLMAINAQAATFTFIGACSPEPLAKLSYNFKGKTNVGQGTLAVLSRAGIPYQGTARAMNSIFNTPVGLDAMEVISDTEMMAHGWCYSVDGVQPEYFADEVEIDNYANVLWWVGYAHYIEGKWVSQCELSHTRRPLEFCKN